MSKSCCKPSRREIMRLSALVAGGTLVSVAGADRAYAASTRTAGVSPVFLDLVTVTENSAIMTWYTGVPGTNDGTGRMKPAPAEGEVRFGTSASRLTRRDHVLHIGAGTGYYTAILAELAASVDAYEIEPALAALAAGNLAPWTNVTVHAESAAGRSLPDADAIYVSAGASHPDPFWLGALRDLRQGRDVLVAADRCRTGHRRHLRRMGLARL